MEYSLSIKKAVHYMRSIHLKILPRSKLQRGTRQNRESIKEECGEA